MTDEQILIDNRAAQPAAGWDAAWVDQGRGILRLTRNDASQLAIVEGAGTDWTVTLRGRRIPVIVRSWRERMLAEAGADEATAGGVTEVTASLPGLVVTVVVSPGDEVQAGAPLLTIEAMKMQNEVRAPRAGRVAEVAVTAGATVLAGARLVRLE